MDSDDDDLEFEDAAEEEQDDFYEKDLTAFLVPSVPIDG